MIITIDKAGRVVIPAAVRAKVGLKPGMEMEIAVEDGSIVLRRNVPGPKVVRVGKRLVARPSVPRKDLPSIDIARLVEEERDRWPW